MRGETIRRSELSSQDRADMLGLLDVHFTGVECEVFEADLAEKNWIILLRDDEGRLLGFSTLLTYRTRIAGEPLRVVFSGDTIVDSSAWGSFALPRTWIESVWKLHDPASKERLLWLLITSGFRTYRFLPVFLRRFHPHYAAPTPPDRQQLIHALARERFGAAYDAESGVVAFPKPQPLRGTLAEIPQGKLRNRHVDFFARSNPGWVKGDELVCLAELSPSNLTRAGRRMVDLPSEPGVVAGAAA
jgi:hypothetical protein